MSKLLAVMIAGLFAAGAYAQNPAGTTPEQGNATNSKPQARAEAKKEAKPAGQVAPAAGDTAKTPEGGAFGADKAGVAGEKRAKTRDDRRRNKDGSVKRKATQGGTPDMAGAK
ncbi:MULTISPECIES: cell envelope biogenesis protein TolA [Variovorax]|uniref:Cell envelope biogenesis protein TolA n=1 Tax=Variovorax paradoxus TaxID=34073 RepID=A0A5Q0M7U1_VARPD|nr:MULTISPECIES: cell envelope biogenesis protein TolA [Variovorax]QFZ85870.1 cell envelope biogenesis protein TolA [Variovorax paradoxus]WPG40502.1 cell envelope biogenesis protein TolA [Variovorax boronicumulans]